MSKGNELLTNDEANEMIIDMKIKATINQIERKLEILEKILQEEREKLHWYYEGAREYKPNSLGIIQGLGTEIDNLCGKIGALYEVKDVVTGKSEM